MLRVIFTFPTDFGVIADVRPFVQRPSKVRRVSDGAVWEVIGHEKPHTGSLDGTPPPFACLLLPKGTPVQHGDELEVVL